MIFAHVHVVELACQDVGALDLLEKYHQCDKRQCEQARMSYTDGNQDASCETEGVDGCSKLIEHS